MTLRWELILDVVAHEHDWSDAGSLPLRRDGAKAYVYAPTQWCSVCGAFKHDGKVRMPSLATVQELS